MTVSARLTHQGGGDGPNLVLIHGYGADGLSWTPMIGGLSQNFRVWTVDLPGHGQAGADVGDGTLEVLAAAVQNVIADLDGAMHVIGHSLGGAVAARLSGVDLMTLIAPTGMGSGPDPAFLDGLTDAEDIASVHAILQRLVLRKALIQQPMAAHAASSLGRPMRREALQKISIEIKRREPTHVNDAKVQVVWGANDAINPLDDATRSRLGDRLHIVENTCHLPQVEATSKVIKLIKSHHLV